MKRISLYILSALLLLLQSCIKEDRSECESRLLLKFRYTLNNQYTNLFGAQVDKITVYIFDNQGKYVDFFSERGDNLTNDYIMRIPLPAGKYNVVAYGGDFTTYTPGELNRQNNTLNNTLRPGISNISDLRTELKNTPGVENYLYPASVPDDLYAGFTANAVAQINNQNSTEIELIKDTKQIKVRITSPEPVNTPFDIYITAQNGRYLYNNSIDTEHGVFKYMPVNTSMEANFMEANLKIMRLVLGLSPMLVIRNPQTSEILYNENIITQIIQTGKYVTQEDFDREYLFVFEITFRQEGNNITPVVSVNGWIINNINPDVE